MMGCWSLDQSAVRFFSAHAVKMVSSDVRITGAVGAVAPFQPSILYLNNDATQTLVHSIVIGRLDYCNSLLYKVPEVHMSSTWVSYNAFKIVLSGSYAQLRGLIMLHPSYFLCIGYPLPTVSSLKSYSFNV